MISDLLSSAQPDAQSDRLLLLAAAVIGGIGLTWLLISQPWSSGAQELSAAQVEPVQLATQEPLQVEASQGRTELSTNLDNPLRMAQLAFEAGMLIEPEDYSAWALFAVVLENEPDNGLAHEGLVKIANSLLLRGQSAVEQGRFDDARETIGRILPVLPDHSGALALAGRIEASAPRPAPRIAVAASAPKLDLEPEAKLPAPITPPALAKAVIEPTVDAAAELHAAFDLAMRENRLLTPIDDSARSHLTTLIAEHPEHELTQAARHMLAGEMLMRSRQALEAIDIDAASTWIDEADLVAVDLSTVMAARQRLTEKLIELESAKRLPASTIKIKEYVAPEYPSLALRRSIEGWVDMDFTVTREGATRDIMITAASHANIFSTQALTAVEQWHFEPRMFLDQAIEQRVYTRIRFGLD